MHSRHMKKYFGNDDRSRNSHYSFEDDYGNDYFWSGEKTEYDTTYNEDKPNSRLPVDKSDNDIRMLFKEWERKRNGR